MKNRIRKKRKRKGRSGIKLGIKFKNEEQRKAFFALIGRMNKVKPGGPRMGMSPRDWKKHGLEFGM